MRDLGATRNVAVIRDSISGTSIELYYRTPTPGEVVGYQTRVFKRKGGKLAIDAGAKMESVLKILTGFRDGDFGVEGKPVSADPASPGYREDWKELLKKSAPDIVLALATTVFDGTRMETKVFENIDDVDIVVEDERPLE